MTIEYIYLFKFTNDLLMYYVILTIYSRIKTMYVRDWKCEPPERLRGVINDSF